MNHIGYSIDITFLNHIRDYSRSDEPYINTIQQNSCYGIIHVNFSIATRLQIAVLKTGKEHFHFYDNKMIPQFNTTVHLFRELSQSLVI